MNDPRVEYFWEQSGSLEVQTAYLERQLTGKHAFPLIGLKNFALEGYGAQADLSRLKSLFDEVDSYELFSV